MLSTATVALLAGAALADTTIDSSKSEPYTTGDLLSGNTGQKNAGNITVKTGGSISVSAAQGAVVIDSNNYVLNQATIANKDKQGAEGIHVDMSTDRDFSGLTFNNGSGTAITKTGIYLDSGSNLSVSGSSTGKSAINLDSASCSTSCTFNGAITLGSGSTTSVIGDQSHILDIGTKAILNGDLTFAGTATATANSTTQSSSAMYGLWSQGKIQGNVIVASGATLATYGAGGQTMVIQGGGVDGYIQIGGALTSSVTTKPITSYTQTVNTTTNPEAGPALFVQSNVTHGIAILGPTVANTSATAGQVSMQGNAATIAIAPVSGASTPLTIGVYDQDVADPGFSFYNRGAIQASYSNYNSPNTAIAMGGTSTTLPTTLSGGFFNSGAVTSSVLTSGTGQASSSAISTGIDISNYVQLQPGTGKNAASGTSPGDQAAFVNSSISTTSTATISALVTGSRGGTARAVLFESAANVPSLINTGSISAMVTTTDATLSGNTGSSPTNPVAAYAIIDSSGSLTSIYNAGTISAQAGFQAAQGNAISALDNNSQIARAIWLSGGGASTSGVSIKNYASSTRSAIIQGDIVFGTGNNQVLDLQGIDSSHYSSVTGNVAFGSTSGAVVSSGDRLHVGAWSVLTGQVATAETVAGQGVQVDVDAHGTLNLLNTSTSLNATSFNVHNGGTVNLGVNKSLTAVGGVVAAQSVSFDGGSTLGVTYASFVPTSDHQFVLMTANAGQLSIGQSAIDTFNNTTTRPYLLSTATMCITSTAGCTKPANLGPSQDALIIDVRPKTAAEIGLTAGSLPMTPIKTTAGTATTFFDQVNNALAADNDLGSAFINGIHNAKEAQKAYNDMAPNLTGGTRAIAISITDSATGPVAARQRALRMYGKTSGEMTLWGQEFVQMIKDPGTGAYDPNTGFKTTPGFKDHGLGFSVGIDGGSPKYGWYGGALTFYAGDVNELSRDSHQNQQWYLLSLYSAWRGTGLFLDTKLDAGYGHIDGKRFVAFNTAPANSLATSLYAREADNKHAGALISGSVVTGAMLSYGATTIMPQLNIDGLYLREEGYTEKNPGTTTVGDAFDLKVNQSYAKSLRVFAGLDVRYDLELWDFYLQPEVRAGYRYDFVNDPVKLKVAFAYADTTGATPAPGPEFTLQGPDPSRGNYVLGGTIATTTDTWTLGLNFDLVKGSNGVFQQVGTLNLVGRI